MRVELLVTVWLQDEADIQEVISELDYEFKHDDIIGAEITDIYTEEG